MRKRIIVTASGVLLAGLLIFMFLRGNDSPVCMERVHIGLTAIGRCSLCGRVTPSISQLYCGACARDLDVCEFCGKPTRIKDVLSPR